MPTQSLAGRMRGRNLGAHSQQLQPSPRSKAKQGPHGTLLTMDGEMVVTAPLLSCIYIAFLSLLSAMKAKQHTQKKSKKNPLKTNKQTNNIKKKALQELINDSCWILGKPRSAEVQSRNNKYLAKKGQWACAWRRVVRSAGSILPSFPHRANTSGTTGEALPGCSEPSVTSSPRDQPQPSCE